MYAFFGTYPVAACDGVLTDKLRDVIRRIGDMLIVEGTGGAHLLAAATTYHQADCKPVDLSTVGVQHEKVLLRFLICQFAILFDTARINGSFG